MANDLKLRHEKTKKRIRGRVDGTAERPRLTIYKSLKRIYAQAIDDTRGLTLASASSLEKELKEALSNGGNAAAAKAVGARIAARLLEKGITKVVFDRNGFLYHGRVRAVAEAARSAGLEF